jgi:sulfate adenylyltransferase subunit 1 (EFTu-like GTPase family)
VHTNEPPRETKENALEVFSMDKQRLIPGQRVEIEHVGEGTVVAMTSESEVEVAVSELETYRVDPEQVHEIGRG